MNTNHTSHVTRQSTWIVMYSFDGKKSYRELLAYNKKDAKKRFLALHPSNNVLIDDISPK